MDSLLANYASSDEEQEQPQQRRRQQSDRTPKLPESSSSSFSSSSSSRISSLFSSLPQPKTEDGSFSKPSKFSSVFSSVPQPKQNNNPQFREGDEEGGDLNPPSSSSSSRVRVSTMFSSIPQPKPQLSAQLDPAPKRVVSIKLPINPNLSSLDDKDDDEEEEAEKERKRRKQTEFSGKDSSVKSFLSCMPAPKNSSTLGATPSSLGSGRRSIIETEAPKSTGGDGISLIDDQNAGNYANHEHGMDQNVENYANYGPVTDQYSASYGNYDGYSGYDQNAGVASGDGSSYGGYDGSYGGSVGYGHHQYVNNWGGGSRIMETVGAVDSAVRRGKRGKNEMPAEIMEVKQDELMKNRPREDKVKLTGIAFGPAYQPAPSTKAKPSKLHKRKHQITSLYYDMKQKEMELAERRSRGLLTKAETQAKYGW